MYTTSGGSDTRTRTVSMKVWRTFLSAKSRTAQTRMSAPPFNALARDRGRVTVRDICKVTAANRNTVKVHLRDLVEKRLSVQEGKSKGTWRHP
jgi:predicted HTH transcriptional regulator